MIDCTFALRAFAKYRNAQLAAQDPIVVQESQLQRLLWRARNTKFGVEHRFSTIKSVEEYQQRVRLRRYEDFWNEYWGKVFPRIENVSWPGVIPYFCWTSGTTTGKRKYIPYSYEMTKSYNKAGTDLLVHHVTNCPQSRVFGGKSFVLSGTTSMTEEAPGIFTGEVSGISASRLPVWAGPFYFPPKELSDIADWGVRTEKIAAVAAGQDVRVLGGMPSWLLIFLEKFKQTHGTGEGLIHRLFPNLEMFVHGGVKFDPYLKQYQSLLAGSRAEFREVYPASEAFMASADRGYGEGMRLVLDANIFYEFVPLAELDSPNPTRHWIKNIQKDVNYAVVLSTCAGSWSYVLGDTVRFVDTNPPRLLVTGRTSYSMSAFGEHLINEEVEQGISKGADAIEVSVTDFALGVEVSAKTGELGRHVYYVEFATAEQTASADLQKFRDTLDGTLLKLNDDYADHRTPGYGLLSPMVVLLKTGAFAAWMESRGKLGGQHKVPRIINDRELFAGLGEFVRSRSLVSACVE